MAAVEQDCDGFECDVRLSKDGAPILWHDPSLRKINGSSQPIASLLFQEIQNSYPEIMTLPELLSIAVKFKKDVAIETKHPVPSGREVEEVVTRLARNFNNDIHISLMSFSWFAIESVRSEIETTMLLHDFTGKMASRFTSAQNLGPNIGTLRRKPELVNEAHAQGKKLFVWTVDTVEDLELCAHLEVDVIATNKPSLARKVLGYP